MPCGYPIAEQDKENIRRVAQIPVALTVRFFLAWDSVKPLLESHQHRALVRARTGAQIIPSEWHLFWKQKKMAEMSNDEWESLCDGCGRCCVWKFEDADSGEILYTNIRCELFDDASCRCSDYRYRSSKVPDCMDIRSMEDKHFSWLPTTCAYRLLHEGKPLFDWHPLISGDTASAHQAGISLQYKTVCGDHFTEDDIVRHIIDPDEKTEWCPSGSDREANHCCKR